LQEKKIKAGTPIKTFSPKTLPYLVITLLTLTNHWDPLGTVMKMLKIKTTKSN